MKIFFALMAVGLLAGCDYTVPLVKSPELDLDRAVIGRWDRPADQGETETLLVLPLGKREYLVEFPAGRADSMFARAGLARVAGLTLVQLEWIGTARGKVPEDNRVYQFASYSVRGDTLTVRLLNPDVVPKDVATTDALARAIDGSRAVTNLFRDAMVFHQVK